MLSIYLSAQEKNYTHLQNVYRTIYSCFLLKAGDDFALLFKIGKT